jgi:hypothetical protein
MMDEGGRLMKYMLIHCVDESAWSDPATPRPAGLPAYADWFREMDGRGVLLHGHRLSDVSDATSVRIRDRELLVSDGPFAETKEQVGGYDVIDCSDLDEAIEIASKHRAPGTGPSRSARSPGNTARTSAEATPGPVTSSRWAS